MSSNITAGMLFIHKDQINNFKNGEGPDPFNIDNKLYYIVSDIFAHKNSNDIIDLIIEYHHVNHDELYVRTEKQFKSSFTPLQ